MGASPRWDDLAAGLDAARDINGKVVKKIESLLKSQERDSHLITLLGSAGCGKSTVLRRSALTLHGKGYKVYLTNSEAIPTADVFRRAAELLPNDSILCFDNAEVSLPRIASYHREVRSMERPPLLIVASRTNAFDRYVHRFHREGKIDEIPIPHMTARDINAVLSVLEENNLLGQLKGMTHSERVEEFEEVARKQILIAMREATRGKDFDDIIEDEFIELTPRESKKLYLCVALATDAGFRLTKQQVVACSSLSPSESLNLITRNLRDIVIPTGPRNDDFVLRHQLIANHMVEEAAPRTILSDAYIALLGVLAQEVTGYAEKGRDFRMYRRLVNHSAIYRRFSQDVEEARSIYEALAGKFPNDPHFWLQYGSLELEYGQLTFAENYINQAESLNPNDYYIQTAKGHLLMKQAVGADSIRTAQRLREEGEEILRSQIDIRGDKTPYPWHVLGVQTLSWIRRWVTDEDAKIEEYEALRRLMRSGYRQHSRNRRLRRLRDEVQRDYLKLAAD